MYKYADLCGWQIRLSYWLWEMSQVINRPHLNNINSKSELNFLWKN